MEIHYGFSIKSFHLSLQDRNPFFEIMFEIRVSFTVDAVPNTKSKPSTAGSIWKEGATA